MVELGAIYEINNLINGKVYIGQTNGDGSDRRNSHMSRLRRGVHMNSHLQNAFNKYGEENFNFEVFCRCPIDKLDEIEIRMIAEHKALGNCYNIENGGKIVKNMDSSTRRKISKILIQKHREDKVFRENYMKVHAKKIICLNNMEVYESIKLASQKLNLKPNCIEQVLYMNNGYAKGENGILYQFEYYHEGKKYKIRELKENVRTLKRKVICVNTGEVFEDSGAASKKYNVSRHNIMRCCRHDRNYAGRLDDGSWIVWRFLSEYDKAESFHFDRTGKNSNKGKPIKCTTTGEVFDTSTQACEKYKLSSGNLTGVLKKKRKSCGTLEDGTKLTWEYA